MDISFIRENSNKVKENQKKRFLDENIVDEILNFDSTWIKTSYQQKMIQELKTKIQKSFRNAPEEIEDEELKDIDDQKLFDLIFESTIDINQLTKNHLRNLSKFCDNLISKHNDYVDQLLEERNKRIDQLGNILSDSCYISKDEAENPIVEIVENNPNDFLKDKDNLLDHKELGYKLNIVDTELGIKISGERGYFLTNYGLKLNMALMNYAIDFLMKKGYDVMSTPHFVNGSIMGRVTQLSDYEETLYKLQDHD